MEAKGDVETRLMSSSQQTYQSAVPAPGNLKNWMANLTEYLTDIPIWQLIIPGSHDSGTYGLDPASGIAPDRPDLENSWAVNLCKCVAMPAIYRWTKTQNLTIGQQCVAGIRYFDMRVSSRPADDQLYFVHGLYGPLAFEMLQELNSFVVDNPKEIVFVDFQHFYNFSDEDHKKLIKFITTLFGSRLVPYTSLLGMTKLTLKYLWQKRQQVIVYYRDETQRMVNPDLWPSRSLPNPWPNTVNIQKLDQFLNQHVDSRPPNSMFVSQGILTPTNSYVTLHFFSSLEHNLVQECNRNILLWVKGKSEGSKSPNIVMIDFVDWQNYEIPTEIVKLNLKKSFQVKKTKK